jgi:hypothetical protein
MEAPALVHLDLAKNSDRGVIAIDQHNKLMVSLDVHHAP